MFTFSTPAFLYLLCLVPIIVALSIYSIVRRRQLQRRYADVSVMKEIKPDSSPKRRLWADFFRLLSIAFIILMLSGPQLKNQKKRIDQGQMGIDAIFCIDVSNSMYASDVQPNRIEFAKQIAKYTIDQIGSSRIGVIAFAGSAHIRLPLTSDKATALSLMSDLRPDLMSNQGTAITEALRLSAHSFSNQEEAGKAIIVITDGEDHDGQPIEVASEIAQNQKHIYTIAVGSMDGAPIALPDGNYLKDSVDNTVMTKCNPQMCSQIAEAGKGQSFTGNSARAISNKLTQALSKLPQANVTETIGKKQELFSLFGIIAIFLLVLSELIAPRKSRIITRLNLFNHESSK